MYIEVITQFQLFMNIFTQIMYTCISMRLGSVNTMRSNVENYKFLILLRNLEILLKSTNSDSLVMLVAIN